MRREEGGREGHLRPLEGFAPLFTQEHDVTLKVPVGKSVVVLVALPLGSGRSTQSEVVQPLGRRDEPLEEVPYGLRAVAGREGQTPRTVEAPCRGTDSPRGTLDTLTEGGYSRDLGVRRRGLPPGRDCHQSFRLLPC